MFRLVFGCDTRRLAPAGGSCGWRFSTLFIRWITHMGTLERKQRVWQLTSRPRVHRRCTSSGRRLQHNQNICKVCLSRYSPTHSKNGNEWGEVDKVLLKTKIDLPRKGTNSKVCFKSKSCPRSLPNVGYEHYINYSSAS
jgi:hypothetical protein